MNKKPMSANMAAAIATGLGVLAFLIAIFAIKIGAFWSVVIGIIVAIIVWVFLWLGRDEAGGSPAPLSGPDTRPTGKEADVAPASGLSPGATVAGGVTGAAETRTDSTAAKADAKTDKDTAAPASNEAKTEAARAKSAETKAKPADPAPDVTETAPETLSTPREGQAPDDLKRISGVGPKLEQTLNELGFWHFDQIANWTEAEIAWVDSRLKFKGRIKRDDWVAQARKLAAE